MSKQSPNIVLENEITIWDILDFVIESWKIIAVTSLVGGLLGLGYGAILPPEYQATANIQVAKVSGSDVEQPSLLLEKLKLPEYYSQKTHIACELVENQNPGELLAKRLSPKLAKTLSMVVISYKAGSPEIVEKCLDSVINDIRINQGLLAKPIIENKKKDLVGLREQLKSSELILNILPKTNMSFDFSDSNFHTSSLLLNMIVNKGNEIKDLKRLINDLEVKLIEPQTKEALLITPIYAFKQKSFFSVFKVFVKGLIAGLFFGIIVRICQKAYQTHNASRKNKLLI